jgi:hypothetical protein
VFRRTLALLSLATIFVTPSTAAGASCTGSWTALPLRSHHFPEGVATITQDDAWLIAWDRMGPYEDDQGFAYHWDGSAWTRLPTPDPGTGEHLRGVGAIATDDVWIVGTWQETYHIHAYAVHWDGVRLTSVPIEAGRFPDLNAVDGVAADDVWAVGDVYADGEYRSVTMHWDGIEWTEVPTLQRQRRTNYLRDIVAIASDDVWAIGAYSVPHEGFRPLALHWDGVKWSKTDAGAAGSFRAVAATPRGRVWAIGGNSKGLLAERWNGRGWKVMPAPDDTEGGTVIESVSAVAGNEIWAAGSFEYRSSFFRWDGTAWHVEQALTRPSQPLESVDSLPSGVSFAAGYTPRGGILALRRCPAV